MKAINPNLSDAEIRKKINTAKSNIDYKMSENNNVNSVYLGEIEVSANVKGENKAKPIINPYPVVAKTADAVTYLADKVGDTAITWGVKTFQVMTGKSLMAAGDFLFGDAINKAVKPLEDKASQVIKSFLTYDKSQEFIKENERGIDVISDAGGSMTISAILGRGANKFVKNSKKISKGDKELKDVEKKWEGGNSNNKDLSLDANSKVEDKIKSTTKTDDTGTNSKNTSKDDKKLAGGTDTANSSINLQNIDLSIFTNSQAKSIRKIKEITHMLESHKNLSGDILDAGHITKLKNAKAGLDREIPSLERSLNNPKLSNEQKTIIKSSINKAISVRDRINELIE